MKKPIRIVAISDSHREHETLGALPPGDILVHCGDISTFGHLGEIQTFAAWLALQPFAYKVVIGGNNDDVLAGFLGKDRQRGAQKAIVEAGAFYLNRSAVEILGLRFWGSPVCPFMRMKAFGMTSREEAKREWSKMPDDIDVLISHTPPHGILDEGREKQGNDRRVHNFGCEDLARRVAVVAPALHLFGHVHAQGGRAELRSYAGGDCMHANASFRFEDGHQERTLVIEVSRSASGRAVARLIEAD